MHEKLHCANKRCEYNYIAKELCTAKNTYYDHKSGRCMTFKLDTKASVKELMQRFNPRCRRTTSGYKSDRITGVLK